MKELNKTNKLFEDIKHIDENGIEFWYARELMKVLSYKDWRYSVMCFAFNNKKINN